MITVNEEQIIAEARRAVHELWTSPSEEAEGDRQARAATQTWQQRLDDLEPGQFLREVPAGPDLREQIDLLHVATATAFELKVSGNNPHHEFYKDLVKVLVYNRHNEPKLQRFVFIVPQKAADRLARSLAKYAIELAAELGLEVRIAGI